ncbi:hypothetical protein LCGC14_1205930 [marine sediment metagenome]|uniref:Uncharacterized protein n=1 Tax=marine sediment metagenome TaxID=412755 RepID=A0A0F9LFE7_9ZZZZ
MDGNWKLFSVRNWDFHFNEGNMAWPRLRFTFTVGRHGVYLSILPFKRRYAAYVILMGSGSAYIGIAHGYPELGEGWEWTRRLYA